MIKKTPEATGTPGVDGEVYDWFEPGSNQQTSQSLGMGDAPRNARKDDKGKGGSGRINPIACGFGKNLGLSSSQAGTSTDAGKKAPAESIKRD